MDCWKDISSQTCTRSILLQFVESFYSSFRKVCKFMCLNAPKCEKFWLSNAIGIGNKAKGRISKRKCAYQGGEKCSFFGKFGVLYFLETPDLRFEDLLINFLPRFVYFLTTEIIFLQLILCKINLILDHLLYHL